MFVVSWHPNWTPGQGLQSLHTTIEEAQKAVMGDIEYQSGNGIFTTLYIRHVDLGDQLRYESEIVINATPYPEGEDGDSGATR